uniref:Secreted protein n=1 Tax=Knipowitschia caucasica TaxID=637954 RepID=A0AAV2LUL7_KNICA
MRWPVVLSRVRVVWAGVGGSHGILRTGQIVRQSPHYAGRGTGGKRRRPRNVHRGRTQVHRSLHGQTVTSEQGQAAACSQVVPDMEMSTNVGRKERHWSCWHSRHKKLNQAPSASIACGGSNAGFIIRR